MKIDDTNRPFVRCVDKNCDGYKGGLWVDRLKMSVNSFSYQCCICGKEIPAENSTTYQNLVLNK